MCKGGSELSGVCLEIVGEAREMAVAACKCSCSRLIAVAPDSSVWRTSSWLNMSSPAALPDVMSLARSAVEGIEQLVRISLGHLAD